MSPSGLKNNIFFKKFHVFILYIVFYILRSTKTAKEAKDQSLEQMQIPLEDDRYYWKNINIRNWM